jgi:N-acetylglucosamine-6-phosphate deacetylase
MSEKTALVNADFYCGDRVVTDQALVLEGERIAGFVPLREAESIGACVDLAGASVAPGFIDLQVNGGGDLLWNASPTANCAEAIWKAHLKTGTTNILATFITGSNEGMRAAAIAVREVVGKGTTGVIGVHFEGPWIDDSKAGVHDRAQIRIPNEADEDVYKSLGRIPTLVTLAPEKVSSGTIERLINAGIRVAAGHTNATYEQIMKAVDQERLSGITHLHNAMSGLGSREPGVVGASLASDKISCGIIADGHHVHFATVSVSWKAKNRGGMFLVTDAMPPVGGSGRPFKIGSLEIFCRNGRCETASGVLGGSAINMALAIRNCIQKVGIPKDEALRMATLYPARFMGIDSEYGFIRQGYLANLAVFNNEIDVSKVIFKGKMILQ